MRVQVRIGIKILVLFLVLAFCRLFLSVVFVCCFLFMGAFTVCVFCFVLWFDVHLPLRPGCEVHVV